MSTGGFRPAPCSIDRHRDCLVCALVSKLYQHHHMHGDETSLMLLAALGRRTDQLKAAREGSFVD